MIVVDQFFFLLLSRFYHFCTLVQSSKVKVNLSQWFTSPLLFKGKLLVRGLTILKLFSQEGQYENLAQISYGDSTMIAQV